MNMFEFEVANPGAASVGVVLQVSLSGYSEKWSKSVAVPAQGKKTVIVPNLQLNAAWKSLTAKTKTALNYELLEGSQKLVAKTMAVELYPSDHIYWPEFAIAYDHKFSGEEAVVTMIKPSSPEVGQLLAKAKSYSSLGSILGYQCSSGYAWGFGKLPALTADVKPGKYGYWSTWYEKNEVVTIDVSVTCSLLCWSYNASYLLADADGNAILTLTSLGSAKKTVIIPKAGWYYHYANNPSSNSSNRQFTVKRGMSTSECAEDQISAIYLALQAENFGYTSVGTSFFSGAQYVKPTDKTWKDKAGNCIDGTILFAAALEAMGMEVTLAYPPGHALVGVGCGKGIPCVIPLETTSIGNGTAAWEAISQGIDVWGKSTKYVQVKDQREMGFAAQP